MTGIWKLAAILCAAATGLTTARSAPASDDVAGQLILFNNNGAWSWFEDERAIIDVSAGKLVVSSVADASGSGGADRNGDVEVVSYDLTTGDKQQFTLHDSLQADDHNSAALFKLPDGRYLASYSTHGSDNQLRYRISASPGDASSWSAEKTFATAGGTTYSNLNYLSDAGTIFNFHRDGARGFDPNYLVWNFGTETFSYGGRLLTGPEGNSGSSDRPYLRYTSNGVDRIDFITTDHHPRNLVSNSVYHGYILFEGDGAYGVYRTDGARLGDLSSASTSPYSASDFTVLLQGNAPFNGVTMTRGWTTDIQVDSLGNPYVAFTARVNDNDSDHRFFYGRWENNQWNIHELAKAGGFLYAPENDYTGLVALDPSDANVLYISSDIDPRDDASLAHYEIFRGVTADGGANWTWNPITFNSTVDNLRPIVPKWDDEHTALLWLRGNYATFTDYNLDVVGLLEFGPLVGTVFGDLNGDRVLDILDFEMYIVGLHEDLSGLTPEEAFALGDVNGDLRNDFVDFTLFRQAYDEANGAGAFGALYVGAPEPGSLGLAALGMGWATFVGLARRHARASLDANTP